MCVEPSRYPANGPEQGASTPGESGRPPDGNGTQVVSYRSSVSALHQEAETMRREELRETFDRADQAFEEMALSRERTFRETMALMSTEDVDHYLDLVMSLIILANMINMGVSLDMPANVALLSIDIFFTISFCIEIVLKLRFHGIAHFNAPGFGKFMNIFDAFIVLIDIIQFILTSASYSLASIGVKPSLLRVAKLLRLTRALKVIRMDICRDLVTMVTGLILSMPTLMWALVIYFAIIYLFALLSRLALSSSTNAGVVRHFDTLSKSLFSVFRCSFGDCTTHDGEPMLAMLLEEVGAAFAILFSLFMFFMTVGLFNVISAIFVDATMAATAAQEKSRNMIRLTDKTLFAINIQMIIEKCLGEDDAIPSVEGSFADNVDAVAEVEISMPAFERALRDPLVKDALTRLDIMEVDLPYLGDILDPQNDMKISVWDIINGIKRLRGEPRRSDIVTVDLMLREIQDRTNSIWSHIFEEGGDLPRVEADLVI